MMCDTDSTSSANMLNKSAAIHLVPIEEGADGIGAGNGGANLMPLTSPSSNSIDAMQLQSQTSLSQVPPPLSQQPHSTTLPVLLDDIATENFWLREKMKEITADRDRLLCEVANLRLELDMAELKRIPEDRFVHFWILFFFYIFNLVRLFYGFFFFLLIRNHSE